MILHIRSFCVVSLFVLSLVAQCPTYITLMYTHAAMHGAVLRHASLRNLGEQLQQSQIIEDMIGIQKTIVGGRHTTAIGDLNRQ